MTAADEHQQWETTVVNGWIEVPEFTDAWRDLAAVMAASKGSTRFRRH